MKSRFHSSDGNTSISKTSNAGNSSFIGVQAKLNNQTKKQKPNQILDKKVETVFNLSQSLVKAQVEIPKKIGTLETQLLLLKDDLFDKVKGKDKKIKDLKNKIRNYKKELKLVQSAFEEHFDDMLIFVEENKHDQFPDRKKQSFDPLTFAGKTSASKELIVRLATIYRVRIGLVVDKLQIADTEFAILDEDKPHIVDLLLGTAIKESELRSQIQRFQGPGRGNYQFEGTLNPRTNKLNPSMFLVERFLKLKHHSEMKEFFLSHRRDAYKNKKLHKNELVDNFELATIQAFIGYLNGLTEYDLRSINDVSFPKTLDGQARLWKKKWNTISGAGKVSEYIALWEQHKK